MGSQKYSSESQVRRSRLAVNSNTTDEEATPWGRGNMSQGKPQDDEEEEVRTEPWRKNPGFARGYVDSAVAVSWGPGGGGCR